MFLTNKKVLIIGAFVIAILLSCCACVNYSGQDMISKNENVIVANLPKNLVEDETPNNVGIDLIEVTPAPNHIDTTWDEPFVLDCYSGYLTYTISYPVFIKELSNSGLDGSNFFQPCDRIPVGTTLLLLDVTVRYDYDPATGVEKPEPFELSMSSICFDNAPIDQATDTVDLCYFSDHRDTDEEALVSDYFHYFLESGESISCQIGAVVPDEWLDNNKCYLYVNGGSLAVQGINLAVGED